MPPVPNDEMETPPVPNDEMETDHKPESGPGQLILLKSFDGSSVVYDSDVESFNMNCLAESGATDYIAICETRIMQAFKQTPDKRTVWIAASNACIIMNSDFAKGNKFMDVILDLQIPCFGQSDEDQLAFMDMPINLRLACFANNSMSFIQSGDTQQPKHKSLHTLLVIVDIVK